MTQRVDLSTVMDRLAIDDLVTAYARAVDDGDRDARRALFTPGARADHRDEGGPEGPVSEVAGRLAEEVEAYPVRQHLIVNRRVRIEDLGGYPGDRAEVTADYQRRLRTAEGGELVSGGRLVLTVTRTDAGWRLSGLTVREQWRSPDGGGAAPEGG
jgi:hypothetical protein